MKRVDLTYFSSLTNPYGERRSCSWETLLDVLSGHRSTREGTFLPYVVDAKDKAPGFSLATYRDDYRRKDNVERAWAVGVDLDHFDALPIKMTRRPAQLIPARTWDDLIERLDKYDSFAHTTWSSTEENTRVRVFLRLDRPVTADEYRRVFVYCADILDGLGFLVDRKAPDASRFWYLPSIPPGGNYRYSIGRGRSIRAHVALATVPAEPVAAPKTEAELQREREWAARWAPNAEVEARAVAYLDRCDPAVSGSGGHNHTFFVCQKITRGFGLDEGTAMRLLSSWNARCSPPWSDRELRRKVHEAATSGQMPMGSMLEGARA